MTFVEDRLIAPLYDPTFAGRLLGMHPARVRRWLFGYDYQYQQGKRRQQPLVRRGSEERQASFLDLMELLFAKGFLENGITLHKMRAALNEAEQLYAMDHPFARRRFFTAGKEIFLEIESQGEAGAPNLLHLLTGGQWAIAPVVLHYAKQIDFSGPTGEAERWWPMGKGQPVVLDPRLSFGAPAVAGSGLKTAVLYDLFLAEKRRPSTVARWFGLDRQTVTAAVRFEETHRRGGRAA